MISLEFEFGYDYGRKELIIFEFGDEIARFNYELEEIEGEGVYVEVTNFGLYENYECLEVKRCNK